MSLNEKCLKEQQYTQNNFTPKSQQYIHTKKKLVRGQISSFTLPSTHFLPAPPPLPVAASGVASSENPLSK